MSLASLSPPLQWLFAWQQIKQTPNVRQVEWPCFNHTQSPFNTHARRMARNDGAERDKFATTSFDPDKPVAMPVIQLAAPSDAGAAVLSRVK